MLIPCPNCRIKIAAESDLCPECGAQLRKQDKSAGVSLSRGWLNDRQKYSLWAGIILVTLMGLYPPWKNILVYEGRPRIEDQGEFELIFDPPKSIIRRSDRPTYYGNYLVFYKIDFDRLLIQWAIVGIVTSGLIATFADKKRLEKSPNNL